MGSKEKSTDVLVPSLALFGSSASCPCSFSSHLPSVRLNHDSEGTCSVTRRVCREICEFVLEVPKDVDSATFVVGFLCCVPRAVESSEAGRERPAILDGVMRKRAAIWRWRRLAMQEEGKLCCRSSRPVPQRLVGNPPIITQDVDEGLKK